MPEYLAPGVYVEETSFRAKTIEGVGTSTAGFVGPARTGPISGHPELLTSFADFVRYYGGLDDLVFNGKPFVNHLAHGVRAFFEEGGARCYVMRVINATDANGNPVEVYAKAKTPIISVVTTPNGANPKITQTVTVQARFPGAAGNARITFGARQRDNAFSASFNTADASPKRLSLDRVDDGDVVLVAMPAGVTFKPGSAPTALAGLYEVKWNETTRSYWLDGQRQFNNVDVKIADLNTLTGIMSVNNKDVGAAMMVHPVTALVNYERELPGGSFDDADFLGEFTFGSEGSDALLAMFSMQPPNRFARLTMPFCFVGTETTDITNGANVETSNVPYTPEPLEILRNLFGVTADGNGVETLDPKDAAIQRLEDGNDGTMPDFSQYAGNEAGIDDFLAEDDFTKQKNGLLAFEAIPDIHIVAAPGYTAWHEDPEDALAIGNALVSHCEDMKYRIAVLDTPETYLATQALGFRNLRSSKYAAIYYPWIYVADPRPGRGTQRLKLPPSGFVAGIYARNDIEHAVFKAPANEVVRLAVDFEYRLSKAHQELLNPNGVNCFRFFEGRGMLLWGARTISDDPEWKYVNLRRYFAYLEQSIDRGTQWAVFENNNEPLWANVRRTIEDFLYNEWRRGGLMGEKPEKAYFVRCDRSTMTQNDLDNGRLVCLIGVAPVKPAEFVIFRIGQWTADSPNT